MKETTLSLLVGVVVTSLSVVAGQDVQMLVDAARSGDQDSVNTLNVMAERGDAEAQYYLGSLFTVGDSDTEADEALFEWNMLAAEQGHPGAMTNVGNLYALGQGVQEDLESAYAWLNLAVERATGEARVIAERNRDITGGLLTPEQLVAAKRRTNGMGSEIPVFSP